MISGMDVFELAARCVEDRDGMAAALAMIRRREEIVLAALAAGISKSDVSRLSGMARSTIDSIVARGK